MSLASGTRFGPYEIQSAIGAGGMGEVYKARDTRLDRTVAIKILPPDLGADPERRARFEREAKTVAGLSHPHICPLFDVGDHEGAMFLVMELLEGEPLRARLCQARAAVPAIVDTAIQLADALECAHAKGIIHRDIKPENIFITTRGTAKLLDFGIAKLVTEQAAATVTVTATRVGTGPVALGTVAYMSPEQVRGEPLDARTDLFSLGVVLYEMATGTSPFQGATSGAVLGEILTKAPTAPVRLNPEVPADLERLINKLLEKDRALRCQSAADVRADLERLKRALTNPVVATPSVVVLPFENLSPDPENAFFADGLTEELIADLSKLRSLRVISRTSAMLLKGAKKDVPTIARELSVRYVLEGSVRRAGTSLRITAQLIDAVADAHLWAEKYNGTLDDVFAIQERVSRAIVDALKLTLTVDERHRLTARMIPNVKAFDLYLEARQEAYQGMTEAALDHAIQLTRQALDVVGPNALLYAFLAETEFIYHDQGIHRDEESLRSGESWARKALELEPDTPAAFRALGAIEARRGDMARAIRDLRRANDLQVTGETLCFLAWRCSEVGEMAEARRCAAEAVAVDPLLWFCRWSQAWVALLDGDFEGALGRWRDGLDSKADEVIKIYFLAVFTSYAGRMDEARDLFGQIVGAGRPVFSMVAAALRALYSRDTEGAARLLGNDALRDAARLDKEFSWWLAAGCSFAGKTDEALYWLANAIDLGFVNHHFFSTIDPFLATLCGDTRFEALMERAREKQRAFGFAPSVAAQPEHRVGGGSL